MNRTRILVVGLMMGLMALSGTRAGAQEAKGNAVTCDFENGIPKDWKLTGSSRGAEKQIRQPMIELEKRNDGTMLELGRSALLTMGNGQYLNFTAEATVQREYDMTTTQIGFEFRNGYRIYIRRPGRVELLDPKGGRQSGMTRSRETKQPMTLKIVASGPIVRAFVDGKIDGTFDGIAMTPGPVALYQGDQSDHGDVAHNAYIDNIKLEPNPAPAHFLIWEPVTGEDKALVFDPSQDVNLKFNVRNYADVDQPVKLDLDVSTFTDKPVLAKADDLGMVKAGGSQMVEAKLGKLPEGFYRMTFKPSGETLPLAVHVRGTVTPDQLTTPKIMIGVYWYYLHWELSPVWANTYMHAACNDLRKHNFNTIIDPGTRREDLDVALQYGLRCFTRGTGSLTLDKDGRSMPHPTLKGENLKTIDHPVVVGGLISDEPHISFKEAVFKEYAANLPKYPDKLFTTCMLGNHGVEGRVEEDMPNCLEWWKEMEALTKTDNVMRTLRWYAFKRCVTGVGRTHGNILPLTETLRGAVMAGKRFSIIYPAIGATDGEGMITMASPAQTRAAMHVAAAHTAKGIFFWTYQRSFPPWPGFVEDMLQPYDDKWAAAGEAAGKILKNADLLAACAWSGRYIYVDAPVALEVYALHRKDDPAQYFYAVNKDERQPVSGRLAKLDAQGTLRNLFDDKDIPIVEAEMPTPLRPDYKWDASGTAEISLQPGDGALLKLAPPVAKEGKAAAAALPRVVYPAAVANAPADKIVWLGDVKPADMPTVGWIPEAKFKNKTWFPDYGCQDMTLYSGLKDAGQLYKKSLWAHAESSIKYAIPEGAVTFAAATGFGDKQKECSAIFRVLVDGKEKYNSGVMKIDTPMKPVVVDIAGGKLLELVVEDGGDGLYGDYTWWGEARLIKK